MISSTMPSVSVVIPTFNRERYVHEAVASVLAQSVRPTEVIVVDDGSTDGTRRRLATFASHIRYIYQGNAGVGAARRAGIEAATGHWVAFLDSDDEWEPGYLSAQLTRITANPNVCMQTTDCCVLNPASPPTTYFAINRSLPALRGGEYRCFERPFSFIVKHPPWQLGSTIIRRDVLRQAILHTASLTYSEDYDLMARVALLGRFAMLRKPLVRIHRRAETIQCLTDLARIDPLRTRQAEERIHQALYALPQLSFRERAALRSVMSANRRAIGNLLARAGRLAAAREYYWDAVTDYPSLRSLGRWLLSYLGLPRRCSEADYAVTIDQLNV